MRNILVLGGAGYIGSHVCKLLKSEGFHPVVFDNLSTGHPWAVQFGRIIQGNIEDELALKRAIQEIKPCALIHLASPINVRDSIRDPGQFYQALFDTLNVLKCMVQEGVQHIVFSSTAAIYGEPQYLPIDEAHPKAPLNAYGKMKWAIEGMLEDFSNAHGIHFAALRYFNASGADLTAKIGEAHHPETHLIPLVIQTALGKKPFLEVYGDDYPTPDGTAIRDYVHVLDLADAHIKALKYLFNGRGNLQANLGTGKGFSVKEIIDEVAKFAGKSIPLKMTRRLACDSPSLVADSALAKKLLDWNPVYSDLKTIISSAYQWHHAHLVEPVLKLKQLREAADRTVVQHVHTQE